MQFSWDSLGLLPRHDSYWVGKFSKGGNENILGGLLQPYGQDGHIHAVMQHHVDTSTLQQVR